MIFSQDRKTLRRMYRDAWRKDRNGEVLSPLESQIARVVQEHPEYHATLEDENLDESYTPEGGRTNPFLHMGMHLAVREQVGTDRPQGIRAIFERIAARTRDALEAEHQVMEALGQTLWEAQRNNTPPDEAAYLERLKRLD